MSNVDAEDNYTKAEKLAAPIKYIGISFLAAVVANLFFIGLFRESPLVYGVIPFNFAYIFCVAWLAKVAYSWFLAIISVVLVVFPVGVIAIMLLAYSRASKQLKELGYKATFTGKVVQI